MLYKKTRIRYARGAYGKAKDGIDIQNAGR